MEDELKVTTSGLAAGLKKHALACLVRLEAFRKIEDEYKRAARAYFALTGEELQSPDGMEAPRVKGAFAPIAREGGKQINYGVGLGGRVAAHVLVKEWLAKHGKGTIEQVHHDLPRGYSIASIQGALAQGRKEGWSTSERIAGSTKFMNYFKLSRDANVTQEEGAGKTPVTAVTEAVTGRTVKPIKRQKDGKLPPGFAESTVLKFVAGHKNYRAPEIEKETGIRSTSNCLARMLGKKFVEKSGDRHEDGGVIWNITSAGKQHLANGISG